MDKEKLKEYLLYIFFPKRCRYCGQVIKFEETLCNDCKESLPRINAPICKFCGKSKEDCSCKGKKHYYKSIVAPFYYQDAISKAILRMKKYEKKFMCKILAEDMYETYKKEYSQESFDLICYIPFSKSKKKKKEFNHAQEIAIELSKMTGIKACDELICIYETNSQHLLSGADRKGNVFGIYDVKNKSQVIDKNILLVDDIKTTGASLDECAKVLRIAGANSVSCLTFAITPKKKKENIDS